LFSIENDREKLIKRKIEERNYKYFFAERKLQVDLL